MPNTLAPPHTPDIIDLYLRDRSDPPPRLLAIALALGLHIGILPLPFWEEADPLQPLTEAQPFPPRPQLVPLPTLKPPSRAQAAPPPPKPRPIPPKAAEPEPPPPEPALAPAPIPFDPGPATTVADLPAMRPPVDLGPPGPPARAQTPGLRLLRTVPPKFPQRAKVLGIEEAQVQVRFTVDARGQISAVELLEGNPLFLPEIERAARGWRFSPPPGGGGTYVQRFRFELR